MSRTAKSNTKKVGGSGRTCHYCGNLATTADHVVPRAKGGTNAQWNLVPACGPCNQIKGDEDSDCGCNFCLRALELWKHPEMPRPEPPQRAWPPRSFNGEWVRVAQGYPLPPTEVEKLQSWLNRYLPGQTV